ncbi:MAG: hypothetical protein ABI634_14970 [Acidobacteriota bacterium]
MQAGRGAAAKPPLGIAFEGDLGNRIDALLAVAMLNGFIAKGEARKIALAISRPSLKAAQLADVAIAFYSGRAIAGPGGGVGGNPDGMVGMPEGASFTTDDPPLAAILAKKTAEGAPQYTTGVSRVLDTADNAVLIRNMLLAQNDGNASIVVAGPMTGAARLLGLYGARPQIAAKVAQLVVAAGAFPAGTDATIKSDIAAARKVFGEWPTALVAVGTEIGLALPYPGASIESDFAWSPAHPIADAYRAFKAMPYDAPATALAAMVQAVHPDDGYFKLSEPGTISVLDDGRTQFTPSAGGKHRYLIADPAQKDRVIKLYRDMVSAQPAPRPGRGGRGNPAAAAAAAAAAQQQQQQQQQPPAQTPKPADPKPPTP